jgi:serine/threonine protein kinase
MNEFVERLSDSGLLSANEVREFVEGLAESTRPQDSEQLLRDLIRHEKLTPYQAHVLQEGKGRSLTLGNYIILDQLGRGGMGTVFKAMHRRMQRVVALKVIASSKLGSLDALKRFQRETQAAAKLIHPNIVTAFDADESEGTHFLVMEYVNGDDLASLVKRHGPLPVDRAVECVRQAALGLQYAHSQGIIHRDIKPANLLLDRSGTVKVLDMGLARMESSAGPEYHELTGTGCVMGTVDYMAPEQALDTKHADARADIYSLGMSLYYLLTGHPAYGGDTPVARLLAHRDQPIPSLKRAVPEVPESLDAVFRKMAAKGPEDRYQTMAEVVADLERCQGAVPRTQRGTVPAGARPATAAKAWPAGALETTQAVLPEAPVIGHDTSVPVDTADGPADRRLEILPEASGSTPPQRSDRKHGRLFRSLIALAAITVGGSGVAALLLTIRTPYGTVTVEAADDGVRVDVRRGGDVVEILDSGKNWTARLREGEYELSIRGGDDRFQLDRKSLTVAAGDRIRVRVSVKQSEAPPEAKPRFPAETLEGNAKEQIPDEPGRRDMMRPPAGVLADTQNERRLKRGQTSFGPSAAYVIDHSVTMIVNKHPAETIERFATKLTAQQRQKIETVDGDFLGQLQPAGYQIYCFENRGIMLLTWVGYADGNGQVNFCVWNGSQWRPSLKAYSSLLEVFEPTKYSEAIDRPASEELVFVLVNCTSGKLFTDAIYATVNGDAVER